MMDQNYQTLANVNGSLRFMAQAFDRFVHDAFKGTESPVLDQFHAYQEQIDLMALTHERPPFALDEVSDWAGQKVPVIEELVHQSAFCHVLKFKKEGAENLPKVLLVAPMSGLLRPY
jgi:poly(3-hydroxybutyrate) depolymerase